jgi:hypothetical protein
MAVLSDRLGGGAVSDSFCEVSLGDYDGEQAEFYQDRIVKARKQHVCLECNEPIEKGTVHQTVVGKWDGEFHTNRFCLPCWEIMGEFSENGRTFGVTWDTFYNEWENGATLQGCLNRLSSVAAKVHMTRQWRKWKKIEV